MSRHRTPFPDKLPGGITLDDIIPPSPTSKTKVVTALVQLDAIIADKNGVIPKGVVLCDTARQIYPTLPEPEYGGRRRPPKDYRREAALAAALMELNYVDCNREGKPYENHAAEMVVHFFPDNIHSKDAVVKGIKRTLKKRNLKLGQ